MTDAGRIARESGGHPLFTVELLRGLQGRGDLKKDVLGRWTAGPVLNWDNLPPRVEGVIAESAQRVVVSLSARRMA